VKVLIETSHKENRLRYYFPTILGFTVSFVTILGLFAFYEAKRNDVSNAAFQLSESVSIPSAVAAPAPSTVAVVKPTEEVKSAPLVSPINIEPAVKVPGDDSRVQDEQNTRKHKFSPGKIVKMEATAYCLNNVTASGVRSKYGIVAADPELLPIGSIVRLYAEEYSGLYSVLDTGGKIKGRKIDIYLTDYKKATQFGRRKIHLEVLRYGWNPQASSGDF
jgi:3D (Asp-Asp-Asp) domain-containing protein